MNKQELKCNFPLSDNPVLIKKNTKSRHSDIRIKPTSRVIQPIIWKLDIRISREISKCYLTASLEVKKVGTELSWKKSMRSSEQKFLLSYNKLR